MTTVVASDWGYWLGFLFVLAFLLFFSLLLDLCYRHLVKTLTRNRNRSMLALLKKLAEECAILGMISFALFLLSLLPDNAFSFFGASWTGGKAREALDEIHMFVFLVVAFTLLIVLLLLAVGALQRSYSASLDQSVSMTLAEATDGSGGGWPLAARNYAVLRYRFLQQHQLGDAFPFATYVQHTLHHFISVAVHLDWMLFVYYALATAYRWLLGFLLPARRAPAAIEFAALATVVSLVVVIYTASLCSTIVKQQRMLVKQIFRASPAGGEVASMLNIHSLPPEETESLRLLGVSTIDGVVHQHPSPRSQQHQQQQQQQQQVVEADLDSMSSVSMPYDPSLPVRHRRTDAVLWDKPLPAHTVDLKGRKVALRWPRQQVWKVRSCLFLQAMGFAAAVMFGRLSPTWSDRPELIYSFAALLVCQVLTLLLLVCVAIPGLVLWQSIIQSAADMEMVRACSETSEWVLPGSQGSDVHLSGVASPNATRMRSTVHSYS